MSMTSFSHPFSRLGVFYHSYLGESPLTTQGVHPLQAAIATRISGGSAWALCTPVLESVPSAADPQGSLSLSFTAHWPTHTLSRPKDTRPRPFTLLCTPTLERGNRWRAHTPQVPAHPHADSSGTSTVPRAVPEKSRSQASLLPSGDPCFCPAHITQLFTLSRHTAKDQWGNGRVRRARPCRPAL